MILYYLYIIYTGFISFLIKGRGKAFKKKQAFFLWLVLFLIMALRADSVGNDIIRYLDQYKYIGVINPFQTRTEIGYIFFQKILFYLGVGARGYIVIVSLFISSSFAWFFYKYSNNVIFSFFLHVTIGLFAFSMTGIRQSLAISITLFALHFAIIRKLKYFLIFSLIAVSFHNSAIIFLPVYFIFGLKFKSYKSIIIFILILIIFCFFNKFLFNLLGDYSLFGYKASYLDGETKSSLNILFVIFQALIPLSALVFWRIDKLRVDQLSKIDLFFFILSLISISFSILAINLSIVGRLSFYFTTSTLVLLPNSVNNVKLRPIKEIFTFAFVLICILFFAISVTGGKTKIDEYRFFWE